VFFLSFFFFSIYGYSQIPAVVVSSYFNPPTATTATQSDEWTELFVVNDDVNMQGWTLQDNNAAQTTWMPPITFNNIALWNHVRAGTIIIIWHRSLNSSGILHPTDANPDDGYLELSANDPIYFTGGDFGGNTTLYINSAGDMIGLKDATGAYIHAIGHIASPPPGGSFQLWGGAALNHAAALGASSTWLYVSPGNTAVSWGNPKISGTTYTTASISGANATFGLPNTNATNLNSIFWRNQRQPTWTAPTALTPVTTAINTIQLSWNAATDLNPPDLTQGYIILRNTTGIFPPAATPIDGHTYTKGDVLGGATVAGHSSTNSFTDTITITCGGTVYYHIHAYRYATDNGGVNDLNLARGRAYNETSFATTNLTIPMGPVAQTVTGPSSYCSGTSGVAIGLSNSETDVDYNLFMDCGSGPVQVQGPISGITGNAISFLPQTITGPGPCTFSVTGTFAFYPSCSTNMPGPAVSILPTPAFTVDSTNGPSTCLGNDGSIILNGLTSSTTYTVVYTLNVTQITPISLPCIAGSVTISGLSAGFYYGITVTSPDGCVSMPLTATLSDPPNPPAPTIVASDNPICLGFSTTLSSPDCLGTLTWNPIIAGPPYTVSPVVNTTYTATCTVNGCESPSSAPLTITISPLTTISLVTPTPATCGIDNGTITINASGGTGALEYSIDGGTTWQPSNYFNNLPAGSYNIIVRDAGNCQTVYSLNPVVVGTTGGASVDNVAPTDEMCGNANGSITITATGGTPPLEYSIDGGGTYQVSNVFNNLVAGNYTVVVNDANNCSTAYPANPVVINNTAGASVDGVVTVAEVCGAGNGSITITASGGSVPYQYSINGGTSWQASNIFNNLSAGSYTVMVLDNNNCQTPYPSNPVNVGSTGGAIINSVTPTDATCGASNGSIVVIPSGGSAPYQYSNDGGTTWQISNSFNGLAPGNYIIVVKDNNNCQTFYASNPVIILSNGGATITGTNHVDASCGANNGSISITQSGGIAPFRYSKDGGATWQNTSTFSNLGPGTYTIIVEDANSCQTSSAPVTIVDRPSPVITVLTPTNATNGLSNGSLVSTATGSIPLTYSINGGAIWQNNGNFSGLSPNNYTLQVKDANGCITTSPFSIINVNSATVTLTADTSSACPGDNIIINVVGAGVTNIKGVNICISYDPALAVVMSVPYVAPEFQGPPITDTSIPGEIYFYDNITPLINIPDGDILFSIEFKGLKSGTSLFDWDNFKPGICGITDVSGNDLLIDLNPGMLDFYPMPPATIIGPTDACEGNPVTLTALGDTLTHEWTLPNGSKIAGQLYAIPSVSITDAGSYYLLSTTTTFQCTDMDTLLLNVHPTPQAKLANGDILCMETVGELTPGSGFSSYTWNDGSTLPSLSVFGEGTYWVKVTDAYGCEGSDTVSLVICPAALFVPTAFSPNSDGLNDVFRAKYSDIDPLQNYSIQIYNRWGQLLFEGKDINDSWDGYFNGKECPAGVYAYVIRFDKPVGKTFSQKNPYMGVVTLIR